LNDRMILILFFALLYKALLKHEKFR